MYPILFKIGTFEVHTFGLILILAFGAAFLVGRARAPKYGLSAEQVADAFFWTLVAGVLGARVGFIVQELGYYTAHPDKLLSLKFQGLTSYGGLVGGLIALLFLARKHKVPARTYLDLAGVPLLLGHAIGRIGCLLNGCCYGGQCTLPWGIHVDGQPGLFHPAQVYDSLMTLGGMFVLIQIEKRGLRPGQSVCLAVIFYSVSRFIYEFWRAGTQAEVDAGLRTSTTIAGTPFTEAHVFALLVIIVGCIGFFLLQRTPKPITSSAEPGTP